MADISKLEEQTVQLDQETINKADLYKTVQYTKPLLAPLTRTEELRQELLDLTGEVYLQMPNEYCTVFGEKITRTPKERGR